MLDCEFEDHEVDPRLLVSGISSFGGFVEERLRTVVREEVRAGVETTTPEWAEPFLHGVGTLLEWVQQSGGKLDQLLRGQTALSAEFKQEAELKLHEYLALTSQMLDDREFTAAPGLIAVRTKDRSAWNPTRYFRQTYVLVPYCECEGKLHACEHGQVEFTKDKPWWLATTPWIARSTKLLSAGLHLAFAGMPLALGADVAKAVEDEVKFMKELTKHLELEVPKERKEADTMASEEATFGKDLRGAKQEAALTRAALARFLEETAPNNYQARRWGSLRRVRMSDNSHRWLCESCAKQAR